MRSFTIAQARIEALETIAEAEEAICRVEAFHSTTAEFYRNHARAFDLLSDNTKHLLQETVHLKLYKNKIDKLTEFMSNFKKANTKYIRKEQFESLRYMFRYETGYPAFREVDETYRMYPTKELYVLQETINNVMVYFMEESNSDPRFFGIKCFSLRNMMIFFYSRPMVRAETSIIGYVSGQASTRLGYILLDHTKVLVLKCDPIKDPASV